MNIKWNEVTWYSKAITLFVFLVVVPVLSFYIGTLYQQSIEVQTQPSVSNTAPVVSLKNCAEYFSVAEKQRTSDAKVLLPFSCEYTVDPSASPFVFAFDKEGQVTVQIGNFKQGVSNRGEGFDIRSYGDVDNEFETSTVELTDVTFDGFPDLVLSTSRGAYNFTYAYYAYNPATKQFDTKPLVEATNPQFDAAKKTLTSYFKGRGLGDSYTLETYQFENGAYVLTRRESQIMTEGYTECPNLRYTRTAEELVGGVMKVTKTEQRTEKDVFGDQGLCN